MNIPFGSFIGLLKKTAVSWYNRDPFRESSIVSYNAIFSLPGLLVVVFTLIGYFFDEKIWSGEFHAQIAKTMGSDTADQIQQIVVHGYTSKNSWFGAGIAIGTIIWGATGVFAQLQKSLNNIWEVKATAVKSGVWAFIKTRIFSFGLVVTLAFLLLTSLTTSSMLSALGDWVTLHFSTGFLFLFHIINFLTSLTINAALFIMMFKILPDAEIQWRFVWIGGFVTALLFELGKTALGFYFGKSNPGAGYGAAGSIILIMLWTSYSSMIVFFGAEFTKTYADRYYGEVPASETAVKKADSGGD